MLASVEELEDSEALFRNDPRAEGFDLEPDLFIVLFIVQADVRTRRCILNGIVEICLRNDADRVKDSPSDFHGYLRQHGPLRPRDSKSGR